MITNSGRQVWPPASSYYTGETPTLEDIAIGLGRQSRFAGQTPIFYTVLCHTLVVAQLVPPELKRHALIHDAAEAIVGDVPSPWKTPAFRAMEVGILDLICEEHGIEWDSYAVETVKDADLAAMVAESRELGLSDLTPQHDDYWGTFPIDAQVERAQAGTRMSTYAGNPVRYLEPQNAITAFMRAWNS